jgi:tight adherence protein B
MPLVIVLVFVAVFAIISLVMTAVAGGSATPERVQASLAFALKTSRGASREEVIDVRKNDSLSSVPWIHDLLVRIHPVRELRLVLDQADLKWTPGTLLLAAAASWALAAYLIYLGTHLLAASLLFGLAAGAAPFGYVWNKRQRRFKSFEQRLPDALDLMVSALRAGHSTNGALGLVATDSPEPVRREFRLCFEEQNFGMDMRAAMDNMLARVPLQDLRIITTAIMIQKESGGNLAEVLEKTAQVIRERFRIRDQVRVLTAQGRMTGWVLSLLPVGLGFAISVVNREYIMLLFTKPLGHMIIAFGVMMNLFGLLVIRKIVNIRI